MFVHTENKSTSPSKYWPMSLGDEHMEMGRGKIGKNERKRKKEN
jgi:hypothetical protein